MSASVEMAPRVAWASAATRFARKLQGRDFAILQFSSNSPWMRGAPQRIGLGHLFDQRSDLCRDRWPTDAFSPRQSSPIETESLAMPGDNSLRFDDNQSLPPTGPDF